MISRHHRIQPILPLGKNLLVTMCYEHMGIPDRAIFVNYHAVTGDGDKSVLLYVVAVI